MESKVKFVNRVYELDQICKPGGPKFILVDAPAGYGKSFLLREVKRDYEERGKWGVIMVDLKGHPNMSSQQVGVARAGIVNEIAQQVENPKRVTPDMNGPSVEFALTNLLQPWCSESNLKLLLLFDGIEVLADDTADWLRGMLDGLNTAMKTVNLDMRVVLAGRYVKDWRKRTSFRLRLLPLTPFDAEVIRPLICDALERGKLKAALRNQDFISNLITYTHWLSGGHPKAICDIANELGNLGAIPPALNFFFFNYKFDGNGNPGTLFDLYVEPVIDSILGHLSIRSALQTISVFRKFNADILDILIHDGEIAGFKSGWSLLKEMLKTSFVEPPNLANPMYSDGVVRKMLDIQMRIRSPGKYKRLHKRAQEIFHNWAMGQSLGGIPSQGTLGSQVKLISIVESIYHTLTLMSHIVGSANAQQPKIANENGERLIDQIIEYKAYIDNPGTVMQLMSALNEDQELYELILSRAGERGYARLLTTVEGFIA